MKSKLWKVGGIVFLLVSSGLFISCATPKSKPPVVNSSEIQEEAKKQRILVLKTQMEAQYRLRNVSSRVLAGASSLCDKKGLYGGFMFVHKELFLPEYREAIAELYGVQDLAKVIYVFDKSPCEKAGLRPGDEIVSINNEPFPKTLFEIRTLMSSLTTRAVLNMEVLRDGSTFYIDVEQANYCDYPVLMSNTDIVNAGADGEIIYVTRGLIRFLESDSELATAISHELAHNIRGHVKMAKKNAVAGDIGGLLLDIAAAAAGVNTQGALTRAGMNYGKSLYSKDMEREADYVGLYILALSGYDIIGAPNVFRRLGTSNPKNIEGKYAASHPSTPERYVALEKTVEEILRKQSSELPLIPEEKFK
jgi:hypothetical protein